MAKRKQKSLYQMSPKARKKRIISLLLTLLFMVAVVIVYTYLNPPVKESTSSSSSSASSSSSSASTVLTNSTKGNSASDPISNETCSVLTTKYIEMVVQYGDAIYLKCGSFDMLIDAGQSGDGDDVRAVLDSNVTDGTIEVLVTTHPHSDHIGGLKKAMTGYNVSYILDYGYQRTTYSAYNSYKTMRDGWINNGAKYCSAKDSVNGVNNCTSKVYLTNDINIDIYNTGYYEDASFDAPSSFNFNRSSVVFILNHNNVSYYYGGDCDETGEVNLVAKVPEVTVMKADHHGSATSNRESLVNKLSPEYIIVSASYDADRNGDQHPYQSAINNFYNSPKIKTNQNVYFNMTMGTITVLDDGNSVTSLTGTDTLLGGYPIDGVTIKSGENGLKLHETAWFKKYRTLP